MRGIGRHRRRLGSVAREEMQFTFSGTKLISDSPPGFVSFTISED